MNVKAVLRNTWIVLPVLLAGSASQAWAHSNFTLPTPRNTVANKGPNGGVSTPGAVNGSCGIDPNTGLAVTRAPGQAVTMLSTGQTYNLQWVETIAHTGYFQVWFSPNNDDSNMILLYDNIPHQSAPFTVPFNYKMNITIPNMPTSAGILRLIQVMLDNHPAAPTYYYSCANVQVVNASVPSPSPSSSPSVVPTLPPLPQPSSQPNCE